MNDKIINLSSKGLMLIIIVIGVVLSIMIMSYGNPYGMKKKEMDAMGLEIAKSEGADKKEKGLTQQELNDYIEKSGVDERNKLLGEQEGKVATTMSFSIYLLGFTFLIIVVALVMAIIGSPKRYIVGIISAVVFVALLFIIYSMSGTDVPASLTEAEAEKLLPGDEPLFSEGNWQIAGWAIGSSIFLGLSAALVAVGSSVYKMIKG